MIGKTAKWYFEGGKINESYYEKELEPKKKKNRKNCW
jgi:hypothetical protein